MDHAPVTIASPLGQMNVSNSWVRWAKTDGSCWRRLKRTQPVTGCSLPAVDTVQRIWKQDYLPQASGGSWIADEDRLEAASLFYSPYDLDASAPKKRST